MTSYEVKVELSTHCFRHLYSRARTTRWVELGSRSVKQSNALIGVRATGYLEVCDSIIGPAATTRNEDKPSEEWLSPPAFSTNIHVCS